MKKLALLSCLIALGLAVAGYFGGQNLKPGLEPTAPPQHEQPRSASAAEIVDPGDSPMVRTELQTSPTKSSPTEDAAPETPTLLIAEESKAESKIFRVAGRVIARDGTPMPGIRLYAFRTADLVEAGVTPSALHWEQARHLLGDTEEEARRTLHGESDEDGAFLIEGRGAVHRTLIASSFMGLSPSLPVEPDSGPVAVRFELARLTVQVDGWHQIQTPGSAHLQVRTSGAADAKWSPRGFDENLQASFLVTPGMGYDLELLPGSSYRSRLDRDGRRIRGTACEGPLSIRLERAGIRHSQQVRVPASAEHHRVALTPPIPTASSSLLLDLEVPDDSVRWSIKVFDSPVPREIGKPCYQGVLDSSCFPLHLELPSGQYNLRYKETNLYLSKRRQTSDIERPEIWMTLTLEADATQTELLRRVKSAPVQFDFKFTSRSSRKLNWLEMAHLRTRNATRHEVVLYSPGGYEKAGVLEFVSAGRSEDSVILRATPRREFEAGKWSLFLSDETLGTLSTDFEVLEGQENHVTLASELP